MFSSKKKLAIIDGNEETLNRLVAAIPEGKFEIFIVQEYGKLLSFPKVDVILCGDSQKIPFTQIKKLAMTRQIPLLLVTEDIMPKFPYQLTYPCSSETIFYNLEKVLSARQNFWENILSKKKKAA